MNLICNKNEHPSSCPISLEEGIGHYYCQVCEYSHYEITPYKDIYPPLDECFSGEEITL